MEEKSCSEDFGSDSDQLEKCVAQSIYNQTQNSSPVEITPTQQMIASSTGAFITSLTMTPLDVVKIRLQAQAKPTAFSKGNCFLYCNGLMDHLCHCVNGKSASRSWYKPISQPISQPYFYGTLDAMIKIARLEGVTSLWSGLPPTLVMAVPATVVYFTCYEQLRSLLNYQIGDPSQQWKPLVAGASARMWAATLISPIEMVRTKVQSEQLSYTQVLRAVRSLVAAQGLLSLWRGLGPTLLRDVPFSALYWGGYEMLKGWQLASSNHPRLDFLQSFLCGAASGSFAAVVTLPFDVIKTRRQIELGRTALSEKPGASSSTWKIIHQIYTQEGPRALYTGLLPRLMKVAPACAIMISTYEFFKGYFVSQNAAKRNENLIPDEVQFSSSAVPFPIQLNGGPNPTLTSNLPIASYVDSCDTTSSKTNITLPPYS